MLKTARQSVDLSFFQLKTLLKKQGLTLAENSPLSSLLTNVSEEGELGLENQAILDKEGDWHDALIAISNPDFMTSSVLAFTGMSASSSHFVNRANSKMMVGCWPLDDKKLRLSFPWEPRDIIANSLSALVVDNSASISGIREMRFSPDGFAAFAAAADAVRSVLLASTLQRKQVSSFLLPRAKLDEMLQMSADDKATDARWVVTLFRALAPNSCMSSKNSVSDGGLQELVKLQLITIDNDDHWSPTTEFIGITAHWLVPLPAICHEAVTSHLDGSHDIASTIALRGSGPLCLLKFEQITDASPEIIIRSMNDDEFWLHLMGQLTPPKAEAKSEPEVEQDTKVGSELASRSAVTVCNTCGATLEPDVKFCTGCGVKVEAVSVPPTCSGCGVQITSNIKYCLQCGKKIE